MATLFEYYNTGDDSYSSAAGDDRIAQTFTPAIAHTIISVKLKLYRVNNPGTITISIKATDINGHPTGANLVSGTTNGDTLTTDSAGEWREITLGAGYALSVGVKYAIVLTPSQLLPNEILWREDDSLATYAGGNLEYSLDAGASWAAVGDYDFMFEEYGAYLSSESAGIIAVVETRLHYIDAYGVERFIEGTVVV